MSHVYPFFYSDNCNTFGVFYISETTKELLEKLGIELKFEENTEFIYVAIGQVTVDEEWRRGWNKKHIYEVVETKNVSIVSQSSWSEPCQYCDEKRFRTSVFATSSIGIIKIHEYYYQAETRMALNLHDQRGEGYHYIILVKDENMLKDWSYYRMRKRREEALNKLMALTTSKEIFKEIPPEKSSEALKIVNTYRDVLEFYNEEENEIYVEVDHNKWFVIPKISKSE